MLNKIQKYLLLHHPLIWNIRLVPMIFIILLINGLMFITGYFVTHIVFTDSYFSSTKDIESFYPICVLIAIVLLTGWLIFYNRNNAFKTYYPRKPFQIYLEWLLIISITTGIAVLPVSLTSGRMERWQSVASEKEAKETISYLQQIKILLPENNDVYDYLDNTGSNYIEVTDSLHKYHDIFDIYTSSLYTGPSFLYYSYRENDIQIGFDFYQNEEREYVKYNQITSFSPQTKKAIQDVLLVKQWLREGQKDSLLNLMDKLQLLHEKHALPYSLDKEEWFKRIYRPPYFIYDQEANMNFWYNDTRYDELLATYKQIDNCHNKWNDLSQLLLFCLCIAFLVSAFIFSFRITNGRAWLIALITSGALCFITCLIMIFAEAEYDISDITLFILISAWIISFACMQVAIYKKAKVNNAKGKSYIFMNIYLWLLPCMIPLFFLGYRIFYDLVHRHWSTKFEEDITYMFWINLAVNIIIMYPVAQLIRKWKNTPDE